MDMEFFTNVMGSSLVKGKRSRRFRPWVCGEEQQDPWGCSESTHEDEHESEDEEMAAHSLVLLSHGASSALNLVPTPSLYKRAMKKPKESHSADSPYHGEKKSSYKCKTCSKIFLSFQALGGHRASCSHTTTTADSEHANEKSSGSNNKMRVHECPICCRVFSSGQALGGHKRTHSTPPPPPPPPMYSSSATENEYDQRAELDLNMPAPLDDCYTQTEDSSAEPFSTMVKTHCKMTPPFWWMNNTGKRFPLVYHGGAADEADSKALLGQDLGLKQDLFMLATVN